MKTIGFLLILIALASATFGQRQATLSDEVYISGTLEVRTSWRTGSTVGFWVKSNLKGMPTRTLVGGDCLSLYFIPLETYTLDNRSLGLHNPYSTIKAEKGMVGRDILDFVCRTAPRI